MTPPLKNPGYAHAAKFKHFDEIAGTISQFLSSEQPCEPKSLDVALNNAGAEKNTSGKLVVAVNIGGHSIRLLNARSVSAGEISVLCHWRFSNSLI